ncbi:MAG TPA: cadherin-like domain-containing protein [Acidimicrobiales bacterium]|nr:cadherin-like domain-containing protein [Acidimicrobiales bacterium]
MSRWGWLGLVVMLASMAAPAVPAAANHEPPPESHDRGGAGSLEGRELVEDQDGSPCFRVTRHLFGLRGEGTYQGRTATGAPVVFRGQIGAGETRFANGPLQVQIQNTEPYYHSPFGTHGTEAGGGAGCSPSTVATPIPAEFRVFAAEGTQDSDGDKDVDVLTGAAWVYRLDGTGTKVPCVAHGSYARGTKENPAFGDPDEVAEWTLDEDCVVVGNAAGTPGTGTAPLGTFHTSHGAHYPCFGDVMAGDCPTNIQHQYAQFLPKLGPFLTLTGPTSAVVGCDRPVTVNARLTVDGLAQRNAAVTFSVAGPAPAAPPTGAGTTGSDGRAAFTFGAAQPGDYTVTAKATYDGQERVANHTVRFDQLPPLSVTLAGPTKGQTEEDTTVIATVRDACGTLSGALVNFSVAWPPQDTPWVGQATPSAGSATTDGYGRASFNFSGNRAGDYAVTASTSLGIEQDSATHTAHLDINTLSRVGAISLAKSGIDPSNGGETDLRGALVDPTGTYAYFASYESSAVKVDLRTFQRVGALQLSEATGTPGPAVIDPTGDYAYFAVWPGLVKVDLRTFQVVGTLTLDTDEATLLSAVIDPVGRYAYFGTDNLPAKVVKIDLATFQRVGAITLQTGEWRVDSAVMDPAGNFAYFAARGQGSSPATLVKVDLTTFQRVASFTFTGASEHALVSAVVDPAGTFAYLGVSDRLGKVIKVDLATLRPVATLTDFAPDIESDLFTAVMDPAGRFAYFGAESQISPQRTTIVQVDLATFQRAHSITLASDELQPRTAVIDPSGGSAYFGAKDPSFPRLPNKVVKVSLKRPPSPALAADADAYATDYETPLTVPAPGVLAGDTDSDGDPLVAGQASDPAGGSVTLNPNGSFTYTPDANFAGTDTFTYTASDGMGYSAPATVSVVVAPPAGLTGRAYGFQSNVSLFGGPSEQRGPAPTVTLPLTGSPTPVTATAPTGDAVYGPADLFTSGQLDVSTEGSMGPNPSVITTATVANVNRDLNEKLTAAGISATCSATKSGASGSTTITNGVLQTSEGDPKLEGDETNITLPTNPGPNTTYEGQIETVGDFFRYVFNEQIHNPDGSITVYAAHQYLLGPTAIGHLYIGKVECGVPDVPAVVRAVADFDADGDTDRSVFRDGAWYAEGQPTAYFGIAGDDPVAGDYDGNGSLERAVYREGAWLTEGQPSVYLGEGSDLPVPGDYDGDGDTDRAVFRPSVGAWYIEGREPIFHGAPGDVPVPGDYDANGTTDVGIWRPSVGGWYIAGQATEYIGLEGDIPVPGDYDANGSTDRGVWRPAVGGWYIAGQATEYIGLEGDVPVPGDYDANGSTDRGIWRPAVGGWYVQGQATAYLGATGDVPLPLSAAIYRAFF